MSFSPSQKENEMSYEKTAAELDLADAWKIIPKLQQRITELETDKARILEIHNKLLDQWCHTEDGSCFAVNGESNTFSIIHNDMRKALTTTSSTWLADHDVEVLKNATVYAEFYVKSGDLSGVTNCPVKSHTVNDDGSLTVRLDFWPMHGQR
jgi:hypothetical protein